MSGSKRTRNMQECQDDLVSLSYVYAQKQQIDDLVNLLNVYMADRNDDEVTDEVFTKSKKELMAEIDALDKLVSQVTPSKSGTQQLDKLRSILTDLKKTLPADWTSISTEKVARETEKKFGGINERTALLGARAKEFARVKKEKKPGILSPSFSKAALGIVFAAIGVAAAILAGPPGWIVGLAVGLGVLGFACGWGGGHVVDRYTSRRGVGGGGGVGGSGGGGDAPSPRSPYADPRLRSDGRRPSVEADEHARTSSATSRPQTGYTHDHSPSDEARSGQSARKKGR